MRLTYICFPILELEDKSVGRLDNHLLNTLLKEGRFKHLCAEDNA